MEEKNTNLADSNESGYEEADDRSDEFKLRAVHAEHSYRKPPREKKEKKSRLGITHSAVAKTAAFILCILMLCVTAVSIFGAVWMLKLGCYWTSEENLREDTFRQLADKDDYNIIYRIKNEQYEDLEDFLKYKNIGYVKVESENENFETYEKSIKPVDERYTFTFYWTFEYNEAYDIVEYHSLSSDYDPEEYPPDKVWTVTIGVASELEAPDDYYWLDLLITVIYALRYWIYLIGIGAFIISILCFVFLMCAAGRRRGCPGVKASLLTKIPFEIPTAIVAFVSIFILSCIDCIGYYNDIAVVVGLIVWALVTVILLIFWFMSLAIRIKLGTLLKNTIIYRILHLIWRGIRFVCRSICAFVRAIPLIWKTILLIAAVSVVEMSVIGATWGESDNLAICWFLGKVISSFFILWFVLMLRRLQKGGREIADGNVDYKIDTKYLILDCKKHGEDLNRIRDGLNLAVEERLKSERMKTELITNVSHDIKTPLTSIINYSDLICREECDNEKIKEYAGVLHNQSERMKRLIDDLVEASKASSGNLDIALAECDARVLITQASGEYCQRLADAGLELVCTAPDNEVKIMADGRRLWRVFDNLMNNARKYALPGTRVYISLEEIGGRAVFRFKNISREPLALDASELTERFVRGDASRNTEGNGLGLSIAKSLVELQGGVFDITVDGDLFKVTVSFPKIR